MSNDPKTSPPYFERNLDRWKLAVLLILFLVLLLTALLWPDDAPVTVGALLPQFVLKRAVFAG